ncbi:MAG: cupredoxin domain-containing protein [Nitrososphaeraceae archaeon]
MGQPGKIAFPVILVLGAITGYITYSYFTTAIPEENRIDSPYYQPLSPTSGGNEAGNNGEAVQTAGGGSNQTTAAGGGNQTTAAGGGNQTGETAAGGAGGGGATAGGSTINILEGSSIQGSPDYDPDELTVSAGTEVTVVNQDTVLHTATSGTGPQDPESAQQFDTSLINAGESAPLSLAQVAPGQYDYYCIVHPYMTGKIVVQ